MSTLGRTLDEEGFIHCSADGAQGATVLHNYYGQLDEPLVVLVIDTDRVPSEIRYEVPGGASDAFPHIYGPLPVDAVVAIAPVTARRRRSPHVAGSRSGRLNSYAPPPCHSNRPRTRSTRTASPSPCTTGAATAHRCCSRIRRASTAASGHPSPNDSSDTGATPTPSTSAGTATATRRQLDEENYSWHGFADDARAVTRHLGLAGNPHLLACGHSKGGAALLLGEAESPGTYPRIWTYEPIMFPGESPLPAGPGVRYGDLRAPPAQRVAVDRGRVRRVRVQAAA